MYSIPETLCLELYFSELFPQSQISMVDVYINKCCGSSRENMSVFCWAMLSPKAGCRIHYILQYWTQCSLPQCCANLRSPVTVHLATYSIAWIWSGYAQKRPSWLKIPSFNSTYSAPPTTSIRWRHFTQDVNRCLKFLILLCRGSHF